MIFVGSCETQKYNPLNPDNLCDTPSDAGHCILGLEGNCTHGLSLVIYKVAHLDVTQLIEKTWDVPLTYTCPSSPTTSPVGERVSTGGIRTEERELGLRKGHE